MFEEPIYVPQTSFSHGEVSPALYGRTDLQGYTSGLRTSRNGFVRTEGSWSNRQGTNYCAPATTATPRASYIIPFTFNVGQSYVIEFGAGTFQAFYQGAALANITGTTPYAIADLPALRYTQSADTLVVVHPKYPTYEFKRITDPVTSLVSFTFLPVTFTGGPFLQQNTDGVTFVSASASSGTVVLTASAPIFNVNHVGALFQLTQQDLSTIQPWEPANRLNQAVDYIVGILGKRCRSNLKNYICVGYPGYNLAAGQNAIVINTGTVAPNHSQGTQADGSGYAIPNGPNAAGVLWQYTDSGYGVVKITSFLSASQVVGDVQPNYVGGPGLLPIPVVGGPTPDVVGPWTFTGDGITKTFNTATATVFDPNKFLVTINTAYVSPSLYSITSTNVVFLTAPRVSDVIVVTQILSLGQTSYWAFGAFSPDQGYPSAASYIPDRLLLSATPKQPVGVFASKTSDYHNHSQSNPIVNSDAFAVFLNARQLNAISDIAPLQDLIIGTANIIWRLWPGSTGTAMGPLAIKADPQAFLGASPGCASVLYGDSLLYVTYGGRRIRDLFYQFQMDKYGGTEVTAYSRHLVPFGTEIIKMQYAPDPWGQVYALRSDGILLACTYVREQQMTAWSRWDTQGLVEDIALVPENNSFALYMIVNRTIKGVTVRYVERLAQWETRTIYDYQFMDCNLTYDGRNTSATTMTLSQGSTWIAGDTGLLIASNTGGWANFAASDAVIGNQIQLFDSSGQLARVLITGFISIVSVHVRFVDPIPTDLQGAPTRTWTFARKVFTGANALAGQTVACLADANVVAGTNGTPTVAVDSNGGFTLPTPCGVVCVGLQYLSDLETLALNAPSIESLRVRAKGIPHIYLDVTGTRGLMTGTNFDTLFPIKEREFEPYLSPTNLQEGVIENIMVSDFDSEAHVCVRQTFPLPVTIRMVIPAINVGEPEA